MAYSLKGLLRNRNVILTSALLIGLLWGKGAVVIIAIATPSLLGWGNEEAGAWPFFAWSEKY